MKSTAPYESVSVVIPTFNRWDILRETLLALERQTWRDFEVIVVDDGSTDGTWEHLQGWQKQTTFNLKILRQENSGPGQARNHALRYATGDLVLFLGDDIVPDPVCVKSHIEKHNQLGGECTVLGFVDWHREKVQVTPFLEFINSDGQQFGYGHLRDGDKAPFNCFYTSNISVPRTVLGDEPFHHSIKTAAWDDIELGYRLSLRGLRIVYHLQASARHLHPMTLASFFRRQKQVGAAIHTLLALHPDLEMNDAMPPIRPPRLFYLARYVLVLFLPLLNCLDQLKVALPFRLYRDLLLCAYFIGKSQGRASSR